MKFSKNTRPLVLCFGGHDPTGGAGIQADIEAVSSAGGHALPIVTCLTAQNTRGLDSLADVEPNFLRHQLDTLIKACKPNAVKIGAIGSASIAAVMTTFLSDHPNLPVVLDPVFCASNGGALVDSSEFELHALYRPLLRRATLITPNHDELFALAENPNTDRALNVLFSIGIKNIFLTGGHEQDKRICNRLFCAGVQTAQFFSPRLPGEFHGTGCTISAYIAARLAGGVALEDACEQATRYMEHALSSAFSIDDGHLIPNRRPS